MSVVPGGKRILVEACVDSVDAALAAERAGADRIELNAALELDGLTPSAGLVQRVVAAVRIPVIAMVRPRSGNFCYSDDQWETMLADARWLLEAGVDGLAFGSLSASGDVREDHCRQMRALSSQVEIVFHKAFDETADWQRALDALMQAGVNRVMSSGLEATASLGIPRLADMRRRAGGRIEILPAGGIRHLNVAAVIGRTGCDQVHGSFRLTRDATAEEIHAEILATRTRLVDFPAASEPEAG